MAATLWIEAGWRQAETDSSISFGASTEQEEEEEEEEDAELLRHIGQRAPQAQTSSRWRLAARAAATAAGAGAVGMLGAAVMSRPIAPREMRTEGLQVVSQESYGLTSCASKVEGQGCANWDALKLEEPAILQSAHACNVKCNNTPGCAGYNFQKSKPGSCSGEAIAVGSCYLWSSAECTAEKNACWDNYALSAPIATLWRRNGEGKGCSNWQSIHITGVEGLRSADACGVVCSKTSSCTGFGFQVRECGGEVGHARGTCSLWNGTCEQGANDCWDNYEMRDAPPSSPTGPQWSVPSGGKGCSNWETILIDEGTREVSAYACGQLCRATEGCVGYGFQSDGSPQCVNTSKGLKQGTCYLHKGTCKEVSNSCWDQYYLASMREYCPTKAELNVDVGTAAAAPPSSTSAFAGEVVLADGGWTIYGVSEAEGVARVSTKGIFDVLGGFVSFDLDVSQASLGAAAGRGPQIAVGGIFPASGDFEASSNASQLCDAATRRCSTVAFSESYGGKTYRSSYSTAPSRCTAGAADPCSTGAGCAAVELLQDTARETQQCTPTAPAALSAIDASFPFNVHASFNASGAMRVVLTQARLPAISSATVTIAPEDMLSGTDAVAASTLAAVASASARHGMAIASTQTADVASPVECAGVNNLGGGPGLSMFSVKNLRIHGTLIRGQASECMW